MEETELEETSQYEFNADWFEHHRGVWESLFAQWPAKKVLEIGSFEGRSTCFLIENLSQFDDSEIFCIDTWLGGEEHVAANEDMQSVESRFLHNIKVAGQKTGNRTKVNIRKGPSSQELVTLLSEGHGGSFDTIYIDGGHQAPDVLVDMVLSYLLCKTGGIIICDDYIWKCGANVLHEPKIAIDAFVNIYRDKINLIKAPLHQLYLIKIA